MNDSEEKKHNNIYIEDEIKKSYINYSMSVIVGRALPDARDGLKPVHRRIVYSMSKNSLYYNKPHRKSANVVGDVLGHYHPHGDQAIYNAMVRMAQPFSMRYLLVDGQGNFGSIDGDPPAANRYTEARMSKFTNELIADIDKDTVDFVDTFDERSKEPVVLPSKVPNLLLNGSSGIAVGMATNIPPHNLGEIIDATLAYIDNFEISSVELMEHVRGPDFPTGGLIYGKSGLYDAYTKGKGRIKVRAKAKIQEKNGVSAIIVDEIPYQVNKARLVEQIAELAKQKKIEGISDLRDESDRKGLKIYIEIKKSEDPQVVLNKLYKYTSLEVTYGIIMLALDKNIPKLLNLKQMISLHVEHRFEVVTRRTKFELNRAEKKHHLLQGFRIAIANIEEVISIIKKSRDTDDAKSKLILSFSLSEEQAKAILEMKLSKLTNMEVTKLEEDIAELEREIAVLKEILSNDSNIYKVIKEELTSIKESYSDPRNSEIIGDVEDISAEDMVKDDNVLITITNKGYVKRINLDTYKAQNRGGKGYMGQSLDDEDFLRSATYAKNLDTLLLFTNKGKVYSMRVYEIPELSRSSRGRLFSNIVSLDVGERVKSIIKTRELKEDKSLFFVTSNGIVKKSALSLYSNINKSGIIAIKLRKEDNLVNVFLIDENRDIFIATKKGHSIRFKASDVRSVGRGSFGVRGINLRDDDIVVSGIGIESDQTKILTISENGFGKKSKISGYNVITRGRKGVINMRVTSKTGEVVSVEDVKDEDEIVLITSKGSVIRTMSDKITTIGRATQGVRIMNLRKDEKVVDTAKVRL